MLRVSRRGILQSSAAFALANAVGWGGHAHARSAHPVRLNHNENPFGPSPRAKAALADLGERAWRYAYEEVFALRAEIAEREGVAPQNVFIGEGSGEVLKLAALLYAESGREVIAARPTFTMLPQFASRRGANVIWVDVDAAYGHDLAAMQARVTSATSLIYVCNPNNPTGALTDPDALRDFIAAQSRRALVVVDEAYIEFARAPQRASMLDRVKAGDDVLITRSFSKLYGLAGLRIGYGIAKEAIVRRLDASRISIPNQAGVAAARASLGDVEFATLSRKQVSDGVASVSAVCRELGLRHVPTQTNFMMLDTRAESMELVEFARERGVLLSPVYEPLSTWVRVSMGRPEDMLAFETVLRAFLQRT